MVAGTCPSTRSRPPLRYGRPLACRDAKADLHAVELVRLDDLDREARGPDVFRPARATAARRVFRDDDRRQARRANARHGGKRGDKAASGQHRHCGRGVIPGIPGMLPR